MGAQGGQKRTLEKWDGGQSQNCGFTDESYLIEQPDRQGSELVRQHLPGRCPQSLRADVNTEYRFVQQSEHAGTLACGLRQEG